MRLIGPPLLRLVQDHEMAFVVDVDRARFVARIRDRAQTPFQCVSQVSMLSPSGDSKRVSTQPASAAAAASRHSKRAAFFTCCLQNA